MDLDKIKMILGIDSEVEDPNRDALLDVLLNNAKITICVYLGKKTNDFPESLSFVAQELTVARYRKIGAEGISTEKIDEISTTYSVNDLSRYKDVLNMYKDSNGLSGKKLKTL